MSNSQVPTFLPPPPSLPLAAQHTPNEDTLAPDIYAVFTLKSQNSLTVSSGVVKSIQPFIGQRNYFKRFLKK